MRAAAIGVAHKPVTSQKPTPSRKKVPMSVATRRTQQRAGARGGLIRGHGQQLQSFFGVAFERCRSYQATSSACDMMRSCFA
ncbi:hypothetical protein ASD02_34315 [Ensifer sp. Root1252]|nr:hypothetical protein ASD02_34315 [Ensifer sp. Root1252]KRC77385.1 hypothetical protein ASE32_30270 [Ensifer sp. Root231]KRC99292.1 hypothetical protein ASE47_28265 [Ensifer sp. Root258]